MSAIRGVDTLGFDASRLGRVGDHLAERYVDAGKISGCDVAVMRRGQLAYRATLGRQSFEGHHELNADSVFRIYSMTKPITSVAVMQLVEAGRLQLSDPVRSLIPSWTRQRVLVGERAAATYERPRRPVTVRDLLTHTSGLTYGDLLGYTGTTSVISDTTAHYYSASGVHRGPGQTLESFAENLADVPLSFHPGERWHYSAATEVLSRIVEIVSGQDFDAYLKDRILAPLSMTSTGFSINATESDRLTTNYRRDDSKQLVAVDSPSNSMFLRKPSFLSGAGGLVSTVDDYLRFSEMLRLGGELEGVRILAPTTVALMRRNHLPGGRDIASATKDPYFAESRGVGFGLGLAMTTDQVQALSPVEGDFFWDGAASTLFWVDVVNELSVVFMTQLMPQGTFAFRSQLKNLVYAALVS